MTHRDRAGDPPGRREAAGDAGHRQGLPTPPPIRPLPVRLPDRNGGFPRLSDGVAQGLRCPASQDGGPVHKHWDIRQGDCGRKPREAVSMSHYQRSLL